MKVLVVDDDKTIRFMVVHALTKGGHQVIEAENGEQGLQMAKAERPDLVLLDVMMPGLSGMDVCSQLKNDPDTKSIPIFMLTGKTQIQDIEEALAAGADNYISKPIDPNRLMRVIEVKLKNINN